MNNATHTPGPWLLRDDRFPNGRGSITIEISYGGTWIASVQGRHVGPKDKQECMANACLIAAAPELLEALKESTEFIKMFGRHRHLHEYPEQCAHCALINKAHAAIAKATALAEKANNYE